MPQSSAQESLTRQFDFGQGVVGGRSDLGIPIMGRRLGRMAYIRHVKYADNAIFRPQRAMSVRGGSRAVSSSACPQKPTSLGKWYNPSGNKFFVATDDDASSGGIFEVSETEYTEQSLPATPSDKWWSSAMANGLTVWTQQDGAAVPIFYGSTNAANTWLSLKLPAPVSTAGTPTFGTNQVGGYLTDTKDYFYRVRWRYINGSSVSGPVSAAKQVVAASGNYKIRVTVPVPSSARADYSGWTLERTKADGSNAGPFYFVADGTAATYDDGTADADLYYRASEVFHGEPVHYDGIVFHKGRLMGWAGSTLYLSNLIGDAEGTGLCNWVGDNALFVDKDDGDSVATCVIQSGRLVIFKRRSVWVLEGDDPTSFRLRKLSESVGACGPRAAATRGHEVWFDGGDGGLFRLAGDTITPIGWVEVGHYLDARDNTQQSSFLVRNYLNEFMLFHYAKQGDSVNEDILAFDLRFGSWTHFAGWRCVDSLVQKDEFDFGRATYLMADPTDYGSVAGGGSGGSTIATGNSYAVWQDARASTPGGYVQKVGPDGAAKWTVNGEKFGGPSAWVGQSAYAPGDGTLFVAWDEYATGAIKAQKFTTNGAEVWTAGGVVVKDDASVYSEARVLPDGAGGIYVAYLKQVTGGYNLYAQRLSSAGALLWSGGVSVCAQKMANTSWRVCRDDADGLFLAWEDSRTELAGVYAQHLDNAGAPTWATDGVLVSATAHKPALLPDGSGGLYLFTNKLAVSGDNGICGQRLNSAGVAQWVAGGVRYDPAALVDGYNFASYPSCVMTSAGPLVSFINQDDFNATVYSIRSQLVSPAGVATWAAGGIVAASGGGFESNTYSVQDGQDGAIVAFTDNGGDYSWVKAQRVGSDGSPKWGAGIGVTATSVASQNYDLGLSTDGANGAIVAFEQSDTGSSGNIYVQRLDGNGERQWGNSAICVRTNTGTNASYPSVYFDHAYGGEVPQPGVAQTGDFRIWSCFDGRMDYRNADGSGGTPISLRVESPPIDDAMPNQFKDWEQLEVYGVDAPLGDALFMLTVDNSQSATLSLAMVGASLFYDSSPPIYYDGEHYYPENSAGATVLGLPFGTMGRKYVASISALCSTPWTLGGYALRGRILPDWRYS